jgi:hypothetical protein
MACRNAPFEVEEIEQLALIDHLPTHHDPVCVAENFTQTESRFVDQNEGRFQHHRSKPESSSRAHFSGSPPRADIKRFMPHHAHEPAGQNLFGRYGNSFDPLPLRLIHTYYSGSGYFPPCAKTIS